MGGGRRRRRCRGRACHWPPAGGLAGMYAGPRAKTSIAAIFRLVPLTCTEADDGGARRLHLAQRALSLQRRGCRRPPEEKGARRKLQLMFADVAVARHSGRACGTACQHRQHRQRADSACQPAGCPVQRMLRRARHSAAARPAQRHRPSHLPTGDRHDGPVDPQGHGSAYRGAATAVRPSVSRCWAPSKRTIFPTQNNPLPLRPERGTLASVRPPIDARCPSERPSNS